MWLMQSSSFMSSAPYTLRLNNRKLQTLKYTKRIDIEITTNHWYGTGSVWTVATPVESGWTVVTPVQPESLPSKRMHYSSTGVTTVQLNWTPNVRCVISGIYNCFNINPFNVVQSLQLCFARRPQETQRRWSRGSSWPGHGLGRKPKAPWLLLHVSLQRERSTSYLRKIHTSGTV